MTSSVRGAAPGYPPRRAFACIAGAARAPPWISLRRSVLSDTVPYNLRGEGFWGRCALNLRKTRVYVPVNITKPRTIWRAPNASSIVLVIADPRREGAVIGD